MEEQSHLQVFLSYANPDQDRVLQIYDYLLKNGYPNTWIDCKKLLPGQPWEFEIQRNLRKSEIVLIFLSHASVNKRGYVQRELKASLKYLEEKLSSDTYIIPIKLDSDVQVPEELSGIQWLDLERPDALSLLKTSLDAQAEELGFELLQGGRSLDEIIITKKAMTEKWEGLPGYEVEISIPAFHSTIFNGIQEVTKIIEARFVRSIHSHRLNKIEQQPDFFSWAQPNYQRTNTFDAHYSQIFHKNNFLSILYTVSWYGAGAAHPNHHFETYNFLLTPLIVIDDVEKLFKDSNSAFTIIQEYVRKFLLAIPDETDENGKALGDGKLLEEEWVNSGTEDWQSMSTYNFSDEGLVFYFPPYQIGAYACGSHHVTVPYDLFYRELKSDFKHALSLPAYDYE